MEAAVSSGTDDTPIVRRCVPADVVPTNRRTCGTCWRRELASLVPTRLHIFSWIPTAASKHKSVVSDRHKVDDGLRHGWGAREVPSLIAIYRVMEIVKIRGDGSGERWGISYQAFLVTADLLEYAQNLRYTTAKCSHIF